MKAMDLYRKLDELIKDGKIDKLNNVYFRNYDGTFTGFEDVKVDDDKDLILEEF